MNISCHTWAFNNQSLHYALGAVARMGFRYVDLGTGPHIDLKQVATDPRGAALRVKAALNLFNLQLSDLYIMLPHITLADETRRRKEVALFTALLPFVVALGAPGITLSPGLLQPDPDSLARSIAALQEMVAAARAATPATGLRISIEPHLDSVAQKPDTALKIIEQVPGLSLTLDWAHMVCQDVFHDDISALLPHTRHVQMRQAARAQLQLPLERGRIDLARVVESLHHAGYSDGVCVEYTLMEGWHGTELVDVIAESAKMRDALRAAQAAFVG